MADPALVGLTVADPPGVWADLGFDVREGAVELDGVRIELGAEGRGVRSWRFTGLDAGALVDDVLDGLPTSLGAGGRTPVGPAVHPNGIAAIDHVVVLTGDHGRTVDALVASGLELRRGDVHRTDGTGRQVVQAFFRPPGGILEVVGPPEPEPDAGPARFFGLCLTSVDLDATAAALGDRLKPAKAATQPGRRIATVSSAAGSSVALAVLSPHVRGLDPEAAG